MFIHFITFHIHEVKALHLYARRSQWKCSSVVSCKVALFLFFWISKEKWLDSGKLSSKISVESLWNSGGSQSICSARSREELSLIRTLCSKSLRAHVTYRNTCPLESEAAWRNRLILPCETHSSLPDMAAGESEESRRCCEVIDVFSSRLFYTKTTVFPAGSEKNHLCPAGELYWNREEGSFISSSQSLRWSTQNWSPLLSDVTEGWLWLLIILR